MILNKDNLQTCGIYCIENIINNKKYIGKSLDIYRRLKSHVSGLRAKDKKRENRFLINSWHYHGEENFICYVLESTNRCDKELKERELYYIDLFETSNRDKGYNLRRDSSTNMIIHSETRKLMSENLKNQWASGIRDNHAQNLKMSWDRDENRKIEQQLLFSKTLTKWSYNVYTIDMVKLHDNIKYKELKNLSLQNVLSSFHKNKVNTIVYKGLIIERFLIEDIVQMF